MKLIIAGSRNFTDQYALFKLMDGLTHYAPWVLGVSEVVSGTARGVDTLGEVWAEHMNIPVTRMPADWAKYGRSAGFIRNAEMAEYADALVAVWDGVSKGTANMIDLAKRKQLLTHIEMV